MVAMAFATRLDHDRPHPTTASVAVMALAWLRGEKDMEGELRVEGGAQPGGCACSDHMIPNRSVNKVVLPGVEPGSPT